MEAIKSNLKVNTSSDSQNTNTQGAEKIMRIGDFEKNLLQPHENQSKVLGYQGWDEILISTLVVSNQLKKDSYC